MAKTRPLGRMRHTAEIYRGTQPRRDYTAENEKPSLQGRVKVAINPLNGRELAIAREVYPQVTHLITSRYTDLIKPNMWLDIYGRSFQVASVTNVDEMNHTLSIVATESV